MIYITYNCTILFVMFINTLVLIFNNNSLCGIFKVLLKFNIIFLTFRSLRGFVHSTTFGSSPLSSKPPISPFTYLPYMFHISTCPIIQFILFNTI